MECMREALSVGGRAIVSFKSFKDSRYKTGHSVESSQWRRRLVTGDQQEPDACRNNFDEERAKRFVHGFHVKSTRLLTQSGPSGEQMLADFIFVLEK